MTPNLDCRTSVSVDLTSSLSSGIDRGTCVKVRFQCLEQLARKQQRFTTSSQHVQPLSLCYTELKGLSG